MANIIQNESRKIALTADQLSELKKVYIENMTKQKESVSQTERLTNNVAVEQIVNNNANSVPQADIFISDAPVNTQVTQLQPRNVSETVPIVDNPAISNPTVTSTQKLEEQAATEVSGIQQSNNPVNDNKELAELTKQIIDEYYDLQLHVQEYGVKLEETLEKMKNITKQAINIPNTTELQSIQTTPVASVTPQVPISGTNVFDAPKTEPVASVVPEQTLASPYSENINIFDQMPQTPSNGGQIKM